MSGAHFQINQAANPIPTGTTDIARTDVWQDQTVIFHRTDTVTVGPSFSLTAGPPGQSLTLTNPLTNDASMTNPKPGSYIADLIVGDGLGANHLRIIFRVTRTASGLVIDNGVCEPCFGEAPGDDNSGGNLQGYAAIVANSTKGVTPTVTTLAGLRSITSLRVTKVFVNSVDGGMFRWNATNNNTTNPDDGWRFFVPTGLTTGCWERAVLVGIPTSGTYANVLQIGDDNVDGVAIPRLGGSGFLIVDIDGNLGISTPSLSTLPGTVPLGHGGTGVTALASGVIHSNGTVLSSSPVVLTSEVSGILPVANGGSGVNALASGVIHSNGTVLSSSSVVNADVAAGIAGSKIVPAFGTQDLSATGTHILASDNATHVPLTTKAFASQSANIQDWDDSTGTPLASMTKDGFLGLAPGAIGTCALFWLGDGNTGFYHVAADDVAAVANGTRKIEWNNTGLGFNGTTPIAKPTITGQLTNLGTNGGLKLLLGAAANYGLVTDSTTDPLGTTWVPKTFAGTINTTDATTQVTAITIDMTALAIANNYGFHIKVEATFYESTGYTAGSVEASGGGAFQTTTVTVAQAPGNGATNGLLQVLNVGSAVVATPPITLTPSSTNLLVQCRGVAGRTLRWVVKAVIAPG